MALTQNKNESDGEFITRLQSQNSRLEAENHRLMRQRDDAVRLCDDADRLDHALSNVKKWAKQIANRRTRFHGYRVRSDLGEQSE